MEVSSEGENDHDISSQKEPLILPGFIFTFLSEVFSVSIYFQSEGCVWVLFTLVLQV